MDGMRLFIASCTTTRMRVSRGEFRCASKSSRAISMLIRASQRHFRLSRAERE